MILDSHVPAIIILMVQGPVKKIFRLIMILTLKINLVYNGVMNNQIVVHGVYRHFKGDMYIVEDLARHSETDEIMVIYRALYGNGQLYVRPLELFLSLVDKDKYPDAKQKYRFELQEIKSQKRF